MGYELGGAYIGQMMAKDAMHKAMYGKRRNAQSNVWQDNEEESVIYQPHAKENGKITASSKRIL
ncbi:hypothetical protein V4T45_001738 [Vibrio vulnificus]|nr:hypothetical protein [Vibrio vulnificus]ELR8770123.1 hypothetical protein [Vibrio vulnificus]